MVLGHPIVARWPPVRRLKRSGTGAPLVGRGGRRPPMITNSSGSIQELVSGRAWRPRAPAGRLLGRLLAGLPSIGSAVPQVAQTFSAPRPQINRAVSRAREVNQSGARSVGGRALTSGQAASAPVAGRARRRADSRAPSWARLFAARPVARGNEAAALLTFLPGASGTLLHSEHSNWPRGSL